MHALWTLAPDDADFSTRWMLVKQGFTKRLHASGALDASGAARRGRRGALGLWQRRFCEHQIRDARDFANHVDYIHFNPVKHGLAQKAGDCAFELSPRGAARRAWAGLGNGGGACGAVWGVREALGMDKLGWRCADPSLRENKPSLAVP
ncbi:MAG: transposase IS200-family protein [Ramlibacter sp.]|nr:transposase IS200-family protein [Ramlibacter sp.]